MIQQNKFYTQFVNGENFTNDLTDFTSILVGSIGDKIQKVTRFAYSKTSVASAPVEFIVGANSMSFGGNYLTDGFKVGDVVDLYDDDLTTFIFQDRTITAINPTIINFDGASVPAATITNGRMIMKTPLESIRHKFGLIGINESVNYVSKVDGIAENIYFAESVGADTGGGRSTTPVAMNPVNGVKSWQTDETATAAYISTGSLAENFEQVFEVVHTFRILPFYLDGQLPNLQTKTKTALFDNVNTLRYVSTTDFAADNISLDGSRSIELETTSGSVGWFNENMNGFFPEYSLLATTYKDTATGNNIPGIQTTAKTTVKTTVESANNLFIDGNHLVQLSTAHSVSDYEQNNKTIEENFIYETLFKTVSDPAKSGVAISNFKTTIITSQYLEIEFDYELTQQQGLDADGLNSIIFITVCDNGNSSNKTDRVALLADTVVNLSNTDIDNLIIMNNMLFHPNDSDLNGPSFNNIAGWLEDGFIADFDFDLNSDLQANVKSLDLKLACYNNITKEYFTLQNIPFNVANNQLISNMQYWNQQSTSDVVNFLLPKSSDWKKKHLITNGVGTNGGINIVNHSLICGIRLNYESWISLPGADAFFYDVNLPNNGLNLDSSRFDDSPFEVVVIMSASIEDLNKNQTNYDFISQPFVVQDYGKDGDVPAGWAGVVELFDVNDNPIPYVQSNFDTKVKVTFTKDAGAPTITDLFGRIRMYLQNTTIYDAYEIGTNEDPLPTNNPLIPAIGETRLKTTNGGSTIVLEALIDGSKIFDGENWIISGRIGEKSAELIYSAGITTSFIGGTSGLWDFDFAFSELGGAPLTNKTISFKVYDNDTNDLLADVGYRYGDFPQIDAPQYDNIGTWAAGVQPFIQAGTQFIDGGGGGFTKLDWAESSNNIDSSYFKDAKNLRVEVGIATSPIANDLMDIQEQLIGDNFQNSNFHLSPTTGKYYFSYQNASPQNPNLPSLAEVEVTPTKIYSSPILVPVVLDQTAFNFYLMDFEFDENNLYNGKPIIYTGSAYYYSPLNNNSYRFEIRRLYWNGVDGYDSTLLLSGNDLGITSGIRKIYLLNKTVNGNPILITSESWYNNNIPIGRGEFWKLVYFDGSQWVYSDWSSLMLETGGSGNPNDDNYTGIEDAYGRFFYHRRKEFTPTTTRIDMIEYNGSGAIEDKANWTRTFMCGGQNNYGFVDGLGSAARFGGIIFSFNIIGYDVNTFPIIQFYDWDNQSLRQMDYDLTSGQMIVSTIATVGVTAGHDSIVSNMVWNGSEYFCTTRNYGFFTMDTSGIQTFIEQNGFDQKMGVKY